MLFTKGSNFLSNSSLFVLFNIFYPINKQNEINVLKYLKTLCEQALAKYPKSLTQDQQIYEQKKQEFDFNFNYRNCLLLLMSEKKVLIYYIEFCTYCLNLLKMKNKKKVIEKVTKDLQDNNLKYNFYIKDAILKLINEEDDGDINMDDKNEEEIKHSVKSQSMEEEELELII